MDRGARWATVHGATKSQTWLRDFTFFLFFHINITVWSKKKKRKKERKRKVNWEAIKCDTQWKPQGQKKGLVGGDPGTRSRDSSQDLWWGDRALPQDASSRLLAPFRHWDKAGLQVTAHKSSSAPQRLIPHTERPETYLPSSSCQMFLSSFYLGFN